MEMKLKPWVVLALALSFCGCASLTPDRISVLAQMAGEAAQMGAQAWLRDHPDQRPAFDLVIASINNFIRSGETNMAKYTVLLESLPTATLRGTAGEVYIAGEPAENERGPMAAAHLVIFDKKLNKSVRVTGALEKPVRLAIRRGLNQAVAPLPPPPGPATKRTSEPVYLIPVTPPPPPGPPLPGPKAPAWERVHAIKDIPATVPAVTVIPSVLDVQQDNLTVPRVSVRWEQQPNTTYAIQQRDMQSLLSTDWYSIAMITNTAGTGPTSWWMPWHPSNPVGTWRVITKP